MLFFFTFVEPVGRSAPLLAVGISRTALRKERDLLGDQWVFRGRVERTNRKDGEVALLQEQVGPATRVLPRLPLRLLAVFLCVWLLSFLLLFIYFLIAGSHSGSSNTRSRWLLSA